MTQPHNPQILPALQQIQRDHQVTILLAVESGSRAWGFASHNSDWDVRFIYAHPPDRYLTIHPHRDVIEQMLPGDLDLAGWDLPKALRLFQKSNPSLFEWLHSPIVYLERPDLLDPWRNLVPTYLSPERCHYHYLHMAEGNFRDYLQSETVWTKKYLYVVRPILACIYLETHRAAPPVAFQELLQATVQDPRLLQSLHQLVERKKKGDELAEGPRDPVIDAFIRDQLPRLSSIHPNPPTIPPSEPLDQYFKETLNRLT